MVGQDASDSTTISIEGQYIPREMWDKIRPKAGTEIMVVRFPKGDTVKKVVGAILMIVIAIYAPYLYSAMTAAFGAWGAVAAIGITLVATMAAYALIPPPKMPAMAGAGGESFNRLNAITGTSNQAAPHGTIPMVIGENRFFPTYAANPYTEILGDEQYLRCLFDLGYGDNLEINDIRIGEKSIDDFDDVEYEISRTPKLFSDDFFEISLSDAFDPGAVVLQTSQVLSDELSVDFVFAGGLFGANNKGDSTQATTSISIEFRIVGGTGPWTSVTSVGQRAVSSRSMYAFGSRFNITSNKRETLRLGVRWRVPQGQYDVRMTRYATTYANGTEENAKFDKAQVAAFRSIRHTLPSKTGTLKLALKIKATDQLNGVINQLSVHGVQHIRVPNGSGGWNVEPNFNPAWVYHWLMTDCPGVSQRVADDRMDFERLSDWAPNCDLHGFSVRGIVDRAITQGDLIKMIIAAGRGSFSMRDSLYSVIYDGDQDPEDPKQTFSPANSKNFSGNRVFVELPHGLRVKFQNPELNWQEDEIYVLDDGYQYNGLDARGNPAPHLPVAEKFETLTVPFVTIPRALWKIGRYHLAQAKFRPNTYNWQAGIENLICTRGDLVWMNHDVVKFGAGFGLISDTIVNAGVVTQIITAEPFEVKAGINYSVRVRSQGNESSTSLIQPMAPGFHTSMMLVNPIPASKAQTGDLYLLGDTVQGTKRMLITRIKPGQDLEAELMAVEYDPRMDTYDDNPPTQFISAITGTLILEPPPPPEIYAIVSDSQITQPNDAGVHEPAVQVGVSPGGSGYRYQPHDRYNVRQVLK